MLGIAALELFADFRIGIFPEMLDVSSYLDRMAIGSKDFDGKCVCVGSECRMLLEKY